ncbi:MAG TPA: 3-oxoadipyl-CoA thiolase [Hyphomicrobiaceae bacterium]|jgi:acetyl-CoA C-acetyltransferase|nr:3-oxoadipyl-CoA thiolase [Hyphomicrobiaceae bacterium]
MLEAYIYDGLRTPFGRHAGALSPVRPDDLLAGVIKETVARSGFAVETIDDVAIGCASQAGEDSRNVARHALLLAGLPVETPGAVHNRLCGSGLNAIVGAAHAISCGEADVCVAGGVESMTRAPFVVGKAEQAFAKNFTVYDSSLGARFPNPKIEKLFGADTMPQTSDNLARDYQLSREECDVFALASQQKYARAAKDGFFKGEINPVSIPGGKGKPDVVVAEDEHPRPQTTMENLQKLRPLFADGVTTAGNASGINDGAAALVLGSRDAGDKAGVKPLARILSSGVAGVPPRIMGFGPVPASLKALDRAGLELKDMDVIEINEAFAAQVLACLKGFGLPLDDRRVNPNGGAIAVGHPLGASGARLALTAVRELQRSGGRYALVSMCIGVGQGIAVVLERVA